MKNRKLILFLVVVAIILSIILISKPYDFKTNEGNNINLNSQQKSSLNVLDKAPNFSLLDTNGNLVSLSDFSGKKAVIVNFWASWCLACLNEMPLFSQVSQQYKDDLVVLGVNLQESRETALKFSYLVGVSYPILLDPNSKVKRLFLFRSAPTTYFIDKNGIIRHIKVGEIEKQELYDNIFKII